LTEICTLELRIKLQESRRFALKANGKLPLLPNHDGFIFDLDMTLVETDFDTCILQSILATIRELKGVIPEADLVRRFWYGSIHRDECIYRQFALDPDVFWKAFRHHDTPEFRLAHTTVVPGARETLLSLREQAKKVAIITASVAHMAEPEIEMLDFAFDEHFSVSESPDFEPKPDPQSLQLMIQTLAVQPGRTVYTGDSYEDCRFANNAGVRFVHFDRGRGITMPYEPNATFNDWQQYLSLAVEA
jgi:FMN phosphatase YigB (HAD superfamily)